MPIEVTGRETEDLTPAMRINQRDDPRPNCQPGTLEKRERDMAGVVWRRAVQDREVLSGRNDAGEERGSLDGLFEGHRGG